MKAVATALDIPLKSGTVSAEGELDFRGTLGVAKDAPVGFREIRLRFDLDTDAPQDKLDQLLKLTERYCVVYQTIKAGPPVEVKLARVCSRHRPRSDDPVIALMAAVPVWMPACAGHDNVVVSARPMSPDLYFALTLIVKMAVTAGFVVAATVTAERAGPLVGGLVATLPLGAGPVYVFLALDHGAPFIAQSAVNSLAINNVNVIFALVYALLAQKRSLTVSLPLALRGLVRARAGACMWCTGRLLSALARPMSWCLPSASRWRGPCATCASRRCAPIGTIWRCARAWWRCWSASW